MQPYQYIISFFVIIGISCSIIIEDVLPKKEDDEPNNIVDAAASDIIDGTTDNDYLLDVIIFDSKLDAVEGSKKPRD